MINTSIPMPYWDEYLAVGWKERYSGPKSLPLTDVQIVHMHKYVISLMSALRFTTNDLAKVLTCSIRMIDKLTGRLKGQEFNTVSWRFLKRVALLSLSGIEPKSEWTPLIVPIGEGAIPISAIKIKPTQCLECLYEYKIGLRKWEETWWIKNHKSRFCTTAHKSRYWKREYKNKLIRERYTEAEVKLNTLYGDWDEED